MFTIALSWPVNEQELEKLYGYVSDACRIIAPRSYDLDDLLAVAPGADAIVGGFIPEKMIDNAPNVRLVQTLHSGVTTAPSSAPTSASPSTPFVPGTSCCPTSQVPTPLPWRSWPLP